MYVLIHTYFGERNKRHSTTKHGKRWNEHSGFDVDAHSHIHTPNTLYIWSWKLVYARNVSQNEQIKTCDSGEVESRWIQRICEEATN